MNDFLDFQVATVGVAGFPVPVTGLTSGELNGGLYSVFIAPNIALHVAESDAVLAGSMTVFDLIAALHFCLATKRESEEDVRRSVQALLNARKDLIQLVRARMH